MTCRVEDQGRCGLETDIVAAHVSVASVNAFKQWLPTAGAVVFRVRQRAESSNIACKRAS